MGSAGSGFVKSQRRSFGEKWGGKRRKRREEVEAGAWVGVREGGGSCGSGMAVGWMAVVGVPGSSGRLVLVGGFAVGWFAV